MESGLQEVRTDMDVTGAFDRFVRDVARNEPRDQPWIGEDRAVSIFSHKTDADAASLSADHRYRGDVDSCGGDLVDRDLPGQVAAG